MSRVVALGSAALVLGLATVGRAQVKLEYKFAEGSDAKYQITSKVHQVLTINGTDVETRSEQVITSRSTAGSRGPDGHLPIERAIESMRVQITANGTDLTFDSANPDA